MSRNPSDFHKARARFTANDQARSGRTLVMSPLPVLSSSATAAASRVPDWGAAVGNLEDAKLAMEALKALMNDAVFLDEEAYANAGNVSAHQQKILAQQRRLRELENESAALRAEVESKDQSVIDAGAQLRAAQKRIAEMEQELENNSVVFEMHYQELLTRNDEIARLKAIIEGLQHTGG